MSHALNILISLLVRGTLKCAPTSLCFPHFLKNFTPPMTPPPSFLLLSLGFSHFQIFFVSFSCSLSAPRDPLAPSLPQPTLLFPISTQGLMNAWPPIDRDG